MKHNIVDKTVVSVTVDDVDSSPTDPAKPDTANTAANKTMDFAKVPRYLLAQLFTSIE